MKTKYIVEVELTPEEIEKIELKEARRIASEERIAAIKVTKKEVILPIGTTGGELKKFLRTRKMTFLKPTKKEELPGDAEKAKRMHESVLVHKQRTGQLVFVGKRPKYISKKELNIIMERTNKAIDQMVRTKKAQKGTNFYKLVEEIRPTQRRVVPISYMVRVLHAVDFYTTGMPDEAIEYYYYKHKKEGLF